MRLTGSRRHLESGGARGVPRIGQGPMRQEERDQGGGRNVPVSAAIGGVMQRSKSPDIAVGAIDVRTLLDQQSCNIQSVALNGKIEHGHARQGRRKSVLPPGCDHPVGIGAALEQGLDGGHIAALDRIREVLQWEMRGPICELTLTIQEHLDLTASSREKPICGFELPLDRVEVRLGLWRLVA